MRKPIFNHSSSPSLFADQTTASLACTTAQFYVTRPSGFNRQPESINSTQIPWPAPPLAQSTIDSWQGLFYPIHYLFDRSLFAARTTRPRLPIDNARAHRLPITLALLCTAQPDPEPASNCDCYQFWTLDPRPSLDRHPCTDRGRPKDQGAGSSKQQQPSAIKGASDKPQQQTAFRVPSTHSTGPSACSSKESGTV